MLSSLELKLVTYLIIIAFGYGLKELKIFKRENRPVLANLSVYLTLPCALIAGFQNFEFESSLIVMVAFGFFVNIVLVLLSKLFSRKKDDKTKAMYLLTCSSFNIGSFVLPVVTGVFDDKWITYPIMFDVGNSVYSMGVNNALAEHQVHSKNGFDIKKFIKTVFTSIPYLVYLVMLTLYFLNIKLSDSFYSITSTIGSANIVIVMFMFGIMLDFSIDKSNLKEAIKLIVIRYLLVLLLSFIIYQIPILDINIKKIILVILLSPMSSLVSIYCANLGCEESIYSFVTSTSILISIVLIYATNLLIF